MVKSLCMNVLILFYLFSSGFILALDVTEFEDPAMQKRYQALTNELRCLVCQNESIAGSNAPLAKDLRNKVATQLRAGKSDEEIRLYLVDRFGEFVSYRPSKKGINQILWLAPSVFLFLSLGLFLVIVKGNQEDEGDHNG